MAGRGLELSPCARAETGPGAHLFAVLFPQQVSEGAVGLLKCAQLL